MRKSICAVLLVLPLCLTFACQDTAGDKAEAVKGLVEIAISDAILAEIESVLGGQKFQYPERIVHALIAEIEELADLVEPGERINAVRDDPEDDRVLECAVASGADVIVSGDSHLLALRDFGRISIMSPDEFLRRHKKSQPR